MGDWHILQAKQITNLVTNPSSELAALSAASGGAGTTRAQYSAWSKFGGYSTRSVTTTAGQGVRADFAGATTITVSSPNTYTMSCWVNVIAGTVIMRMIDTSGPSYTTYTSATSSGTGVQELKTSVNFGAGTPTCYFEIVQSGATAAEWYTDGLIFTADVGALSIYPRYVDGTQAGCYWTGAEHNSTSVHRGSDRNGGIWVDIATTCGYTVRQIPGAGMAPTVPNLEQRALQDGASYLGTSVPVRVMNLFGAFSSSATVAAWQAKRQALIDLIKPDAVNPQQPFWLRYSGGTRPVEIQAVYSNGLGVGDVQAKQETEIPIELVCPSPYWQEVGNQAAHLSPVSATLASTNYVIKRIDGVWSKCSTGANDIVRGAAIHPDGTIYLVGDFTTAGGVTVNRVCKYNPVTDVFTALNAGTVGLNGAAYVVAIAPDNDSVYIGGAFTTAGGTTVNGIVKYSHGAGTYAALSATPGVAGGTARVYALAFNTAGLLFVGGSFTTAGGVTVNNVATWSGSAWAAIGGATKGVGGVSLGVVALEPDRVGGMYIGGDFTSAGGATIYALTKWTGSAFENLNLYDIDELSPAVFSLLYRNNVLLVGYNSYGAYYPDPDGKLLEYNGTSYRVLFEVVQAVGEEPLRGAKINTLSMSEYGEIIYGLDLTGAAGAPTVRRPIGIYNGTILTDFPVTYPTDSTVNIIKTWQAGNRLNMVIGGEESGDVSVSYQNTITAASNIGRRGVNPMLYVKRSGGTTATLRHMENETTGVKILFDYSILDGETLTVDTNPQRFSVKSSFFGDVTGRAVLRGSNAADFRLLGGENKINFYVENTGSPTITSYLYWTPIHWSIDGGSYTG